MTRCFIALGGNVGDVEQTFRRALDLLGAHPKIELVRESSRYRTAAMGGNAGGDYLNAVAELETELSPRDLLQVLQQIEEECGRVRTVRWGPRTLDLDLLLYGDEVISEPDLQVPHPASWYRRFVLDPLAEIAPDIVHPEQLTTIAEVRHRLLERPLPVAVAGGEQATRAALIETLTNEFPAAKFAELHSAGVLPPPALVLSIGVLSRPAPDPKVGSERNASYIDLTRIGPGTVEDNARFVMQAALGT